MTLETLIATTGSLLEQYLPTVTPIVTAMVALFQHYTGWGPKMLPKRWQPVPAVVLTTGLLEWLAVSHQGGSATVVVAALIAGLVAGAGSNVAHIGLQSAGKTSAGKGGLAVLLAFSAALASGGCAALPESAVPSQDEQVELCVSLAMVTPGYLQPSVRAEVEQVPIEDREAVLRALCYTIIHEAGE